MHGGKGRGGIKREVSSASQRNRVSPLIESRGNSPRSERVWGGPRVFYSPDR